VKGSASESPIFPRQRSKPKSFVERRLEEGCSNATPTQQDGQDTTAIVRTTIRQYCRKKNRIPTGCRGNPARRTIEGGIEKRQGERVSTS